MRWLLAALLIATALSGCAQSPAEDAPVTEAGFVPGVLDDAMALLEAGNTTANLLRLGAWEATGEEVDAWEDYVAVDAGNRVVILHRMEDNDTLSFHEVAEITGAFTPKDVKFSDDGEWLFIGDDTQASAGPTGQIGGRAGGIYTYFVGDKTAPEFMHFLPIGPTRGPHMVAYHQFADGTEVVLGANGDISVNVFDRASGTLTEASRYQPAPTEVVRNADTFDVYYQLYAHDMFAMTDNVTGQELMYVANWDAGLRVVDISDPASIEEVGGWNDFPAGHSGNLHTVATEWIGERRITVGTPEVGFAVVGGVPYATNTEHAPLYVWDTTDLGSIELLASWENPQGLYAGRQDLGEQLNSAHNFQLEDGIIYLAQYDLGMMVLDISTPEKQGAPQLLAYDQLGHTWDVIVAGGTVISSGSYGLVGAEFPLIERGPDGLFSRN